MPKNESDNILVDYISVLGKETFNCCIGPVSIVVIALLISWGYIIIKDSSDIKQGLELLFLLNCLPTAVVSSLLLYLARRVHNKNAAESAKQREDASSSGQIKGPGYDWHPIGRQELSRTEGNSNVAEAQLREQYPHFKTVQKLPGGMRPYQELKRGYLDKGASLFLVVKDMLKNDDSPYVVYQISQASTYEQDLRMVRETIYEDTEHYVNRYSFVGIFALTDFE